MVGIPINNKGYTINSSRHTVEQIEDIQGTGLPEVSKLIDSVMKTKNNEIQHSFLQKNTLEKEKDAITFSYPPFLLKILVQNFMLIINNTKTWV